MVFSGKRGKNALFGLTESLKMWYSIKIHSKKTNFYVEWTREEF